MSKIAATAQQALLDGIDGDWIADVCRRMVEIPSVTMHEQDICVLFARELQALGLDVDVREVTPGRNNLYACISGIGDGPALNLNGHLDTIPNANEQTCRQEGDRIYGRGTTDMKGGMAAMLGAARAIIESGLRLRGDVVLSAVVGHEEPEAEKDGPLAFIADITSGRIRGDRILIVEGRDALWVMSMGSLNFRITLTSDKGGTHTQYVPFGDNPIRYVGELIGRINEFQIELDRSTSHPLAGPERMDVGIVEAGDYFNRTPSQCLLVGTRRWAPGRKAPEVLDEVRRLVEPIATVGGLQFDVAMELERNPFETRIDDPAVVATAAAHREVTGTEPEFVGLRIVGDANLYVEGCGVPTYYYGPSNETAHSDNEWVSKSRMTSAAQVYALSAANYCGVVD